MVRTNNGAARTIFRKISDDGTCWLFVVLADDGWAITRNGERVAVGRNNSTSINFGVRKYMSLTTVTTPQRPAVCA